MTSKKNFDSTTKRLLNSYADKIIFYMNENKRLNIAIEELKNTIKNQNQLLSKKIEEIPFKLYRDIINDLQRENEKLAKRNISLYKENLSLEMRVFDIKKEEEKVREENEKTVKNISEKNFAQENELKSKENIINHLKRELNKYYKDDYTSTKEILITEPSLLNTEMNTELTEAREIITKYSHHLNNANKTINELNIKIENLKDLITNMKKGKKIQKTLEAIETFDYLLTNNSNEDEDDNFNEEIDRELDSPLVQFSPKVKPERFLTTASKSKSCIDITIPKLNLSNVVNKYKCNLTQKCSVKKGQSGKIIDEDYVEKLEFKIKLLKDMNVKYKKKTKQQSQIISMLKQHFLKEKRCSNDSTSDDKTGKRMQTTEESSAHAIIANVDHVTFENEVNLIIDNYDKCTLGLLAETNANYAEKNNYTIIHTGNDTVKL